MSDNTTPTPDDAQTALNGLDTDDSESTGDDADDDDRVVMRLTDGWYEMQSDGYKRPTPVHHLYGRTINGNYHHVALDGFRPYGYIDPRDLDTDTLSDIEADRRVIDVDDATRTAPDGTPLIKVTTQAPWHVAHIRDELQNQDIRTYEMDVLMTQRLLIDGGVPDSTRQPIRDVLEVPADAYRTRDIPHRAETIRAVDSDDLSQSMPPQRVVTFDIEVFTLGRFPDPLDAQQPITGVTLHDSYSDRYTVYVIPPTSSISSSYERTDDWDDLDSERLTAVLRQRTPESTVIETAAILPSEAALVRKTAAYLIRTRPDILTGWNADEFDVPYLLNRSFEVDDDPVIKDLSPTRNIERQEQKSHYVNEDLNGVHIIDTKAAYEKSTYTSLKKSTLEYVASKETDMDKLDVDEQQAWFTDPIEFARYNLRDVSACVAIDASRNLLTLR